MLQQNVLKPLVPIRLVFLNLACAASLISCGEDSSTEYQLQETAQSKVVCRAKEIPKNWIIIENLFTLDCGQGSIHNSNAYRIRKPHESDTMCSNSKLPDGYAKVKSRYTLDCGRGSIFNDNAWDIERL